MKKDPKSRTKTKVKKSGKKVTITKSKTESGLNKRVRTVTKNGKTRTSVMYHGGSIDEARPIESHNGTPRPVSQPSAPSPRSASASSPFRNRDYDRISKNIKK